MTESEWNECTDPKPMLKFLQDTASERKLRLFAVACCRRVWGLITDERGRDAIATSELKADGLVDMQERETWERTGDYFTEHGFVVETDDPEVLTAFNAAVVARTASWPEIDADVARQVARSARWAWANAGGKLEREECPFQADLLRDIFGNPFYYISINSQALNPTVSSLAQAAYDERIMPSGELDPERLAVLSDALEEAGCDNADILNHLRGPGPHVRGCWAVDLLLGKE